MGGQLDKRPPKPHLQPHHAPGSLCQSCGPENRWASESAEVRSCHLPVLSRTHRIDLKWFEVMIEWLSDLALSESGQCRRNHICNLNFGSLVSMLRHRAGSRRWPLNWYVQQCTAPVLNPAHIIPGNCAGHAVPFACRSCNMMRHRNHACCHLLVPAACVNRMAQRKTWASEPAERDIACRC